MAHLVGPVVEPVGEVEAVDALRAVVAGTGAQHLDRGLLDAVRVDVRLQAGLHAAAPAYGLGRGHDGSMATPGRVVELGPAVGLRSQPD